MSTNKTPNLNLHSWEPTDAFSREEFNDNFDKIDTAVDEATVWRKLGTYSVTEECDSFTVPLENVTDYLMLKLILRIQVDDRPDTTLHFTMTGGTNRFYYANNFERTGRTAVDFPAIPNVGSVGGTASLYPLGPYNYVGMVLDAISYRYEMTQMTRSSCANIGVRWETLTGLTFCGSGSGSIYKTTILPGTVITVCGLK